MKKLKAYKVFDENWQCKGFQYKVGESYEIKEEPVLCKRGFHACKKVSDCFTYQSFDPKNKVALVELSGIILGEDGDKQVGQKIKILKEMSWNDMLVLANSGYGNSGYRNSGNGNSGYVNSGNRNSGDRNSGNRNSGNGNSGDYNVGHFNSITPDDILVFNKPCKRLIWININKPNFIFNVNVNVWIDWDNMTDDEKKNNKDAFVTSGYLKTIPYKEAWKIAYDSATKKDIELLKALPNWDANVFEEITGIKIE
jgi:hypothetical protein